MSAGVHSRGSFAPASVRGALNLKGILASAGISQEQWARSIVQSGRYTKGRPLSVTAACDILNRNVWPTLTPREHIVAQTEALLRGLGVPAELIRTAWGLDAFNRYRHKHPKGCHRPSGRTAGHWQPARVKEVIMLTATARKHFSLFRDPFLNDVQSADDIFLSEEQRAIREAMYGVAKNGGFLAVVGESGSGKTTLRRELLQRIQREGQSIVVIQPQVIDKGRLTAGLLCEAIIRDLSQQKPRQSLEGKARQVQEILLGSTRAGHSHLLLVEEAQDIPISTLKYLKRFYELEDGFKKLLAILLIGQPELKQLLDERQNYEAREVIRRCEIIEIGALDGRLEEYLAMKFKRIGSSLSEVFEKDAYDAIRERLSMRQPGSETRISMVYPLIVNNLIAKALNLAAEIGARKINAEIIREV